MKVRATIAMAGMLIALLSLALLAPAATTQPSDDSATTRPIAGRLPSPAELLAKMKQEQSVDDTMPKVAYFNLAQPLAEKPEDFSWFGGDQQAITLRALIDRMEKARADKDIRAVLITMSDAGLNLSQAMELRDELNLMRRDGKRTFVYADSYDTDTYVAACAATDVCMLEGGDIFIPGVGFETMFAKGLLDKVGVKADFVQIGEYKGADEEYTRTGASEELRGQLNKLADSLYQQIIDTISTTRNLKHEDVAALVDDAMITGRVAKDRGLVDHLLDLNDLRDLLAKELGHKVDLLPNYGTPAREQIDLSSPFAFFSLMSRKAPEMTRPGVAVIYAEGVIVDGPSGGGIFGGSENVGSETIRQALRMAERDDKVESIVIRIDSPGGSALASEAMWQAARRVAKTKPVIISVGTMAASGGYYLASSGDYIFADPTAIVGSIGVVGGKFVLKDLFVKLGLNTESFLRGRNADLFSSDSEWTDRQRAQVTNWMHDTYVQFTQRVMTTRTGKIKDIDAIARGRIFSARQALDLGMVDEIGGVKDAIAYAAKKADLKPGEYDVRVLPPSRTFADILNSGSDSDDSSSRSPLSDGLLSPQQELLLAVPPTMRPLLMQEIQILELMQERPVVLASPFVLVEH